MGLGSLELTKPETGSKLQLSAISAEIKMLSLDFRILVLHDENSALRWLPTIF